MRRVRWHATERAHERLRDRVQAGFDQVEYHNLTAGIVALHLGRTF